MSTLDKTFSEFEEVSTLGTPTVQGTDRVAGYRGSENIQPTVDEIATYIAGGGGAVGTMAAQDADNVAITGGSITGIADLAVADGGTGASTAADARTNLGVTATGADTTYAFRANNLSDLASAGTARTNLGLGSIATQAASAVSITGGAISGITDLAVADGGTGASTAANARTNLGLGNLAVLSELPLTDIADIANNTLLGNSSGGAAAPSAQDIDTLNASITDKARKIGYYKSLFAQLPIRFGVAGADYDTIKATYSYTTLYPQWFRLSTTKIYIGYYTVGGSNDWGWIAVYDRDLNYISCFSAGSGVTEGGVLLETNDMWLAEAGDIAKFQVNPLPTNLSRVAASITQTIPGIPSQFGSCGNTVLVVDKVEPLGVSLRRNRLTIWDKTADPWTRKGEIKMPMGEFGLAGSVTKPEYDRIPKAQGIHVEPGAIWFSYGGNTAITGSTVTPPYSWNGIKGFSINGTKTLDALVEPEAFMAAFVAANPSVTGTTRLENEGITRDPLTGDLLTLNVIKSSTDGTAAANGIVLIREMDLADGADYSATAPVAYPNVVDDVWFDRTSDTSTFNNPQTGDAMTTWESILDWMKAVDRKEFRYYTSGNLGLIDINGTDWNTEQIDVIFRNENNSTFHITTRALTGEIQYYTVTTNTGVYTQKRRWDKNVVNTLYENGLPVILLPSGTVGANGALTLGTALPTTFAKIYGRLPAGAAYAGSGAGSYYITMSSATAGTIYDNVYDDGRPEPPDTPTAIVDAGPGAYTQTTASDITLLTYTIPAESMGLYGEVTITANADFPNNANAKIARAKFGSTQIYSSGNVTSNAAHRMYVSIVNRGSESVQDSTGNNSFGSSSNVPTVTTENTANETTVTLLGQLATATDYLIYRQKRIELRRSV